MEWAESIAKQNYRPLQVVLSNDKSTDSPEKIIPKIENLFGKKRIEFVGYIDSYNPQITSNTRSLDLEIKCTHPTTNEICSDMVQVLGKNMKITMEEI